MKTRMPAVAGFLFLVPTLLFAQSYAEAVPATPAKAARAPRAARVSIAVPVLATPELVPVLPESPAVPYPARVATIVTPFMVPSELPPAPPESPLPAEQPPTPPAAPKAPVAVTATAPPTPPAPPRPMGQLFNVQIEVTLTDTKGSPKTVVLTVADGELGQNRTTAFVPGANNGANYGLNADARPTIFGNKIRLYLSAEASVPSVSIDTNRSSPALSLRQQQTLILNDGDSLEIARAADPVSDRSFGLSVKAKIQR